MNTKTLNLAAIGTSALTALSALPYELGNAAIIISPEWKQTLAILGIIATVLLRSFATAKGDK